jgi:hypothetical protein
MSALRSVPAFIAGIMFGLLNLTGILNALMRSNCGSTVVYSAT